MNTTPALLLMTTISVPLSDEMLRHLEMIIKLGIAPNKAEALRQALKKYLEDQAVEAVLRAQAEPSLSGDLDLLAEEIV
ncbi:MAG: ribbon-helix-helix domain-containing protein [Candidatus Peribacteraceae bacterium]